MPVLGIPTAFRANVQQTVSKLEGVGGDESCERKGGSWGLRWGFTGGRGLKSASRKIASWLSRGWERYLHTISLAPPIQIRSCAGCFKCSYQYYDDHSIYMLDLSLRFWRSLILYHTRAVFVSSLTHKTARKPPSRLKMATDTIVALVTGGNNGIGFETCALWASQPNYPVIMGNRALENGKARPSQNSKP